MQKKNWTSYKGYTIYFKPENGKLQVSVRPQGDIAVIPVGSKKSEYQALGIAKSYIEKEIKNVSKQDNK